MSRLRTNIVTVGLFSAGAVAPLRPKGGASWFRFLVRPDLAYRER
jgi:hypothetical protein